MKLGIFRRLRRRNSSAEEWSVGMNDGRIDINGPGSACHHIDVSSLSKIVAQRSHPGPFNSDILLFFFYKGRAPLAFVPSRAIGFLQFTEQLSLLPGFRYEDWLLCSGLLPGRRTIVFARPPKLPAASTPTYNVLSRLSSSQG